MLAPSMQIKPTTIEMIRSDDIGPSPQHLQSRDHTLHHSQLPSFSGEGVLAHYTLEKHGPLRQRAVPALLL